MNPEKRKVSTDALETLGTIIADGGRDAIHLAVEPVEAGEMMLPGQKIGIRDGKAYYKDVKHLGIVDPFLSEPVQIGEKFWLVVFPRQITSLRHVWGHPDFPEDVTTDKAEPTELEISKAWIASFAEQLDQTYNRLMSAADMWVDTDDGEYGGEYTYDNSETYKDHWEKFPEFWEHYKVVRGKEPVTKGSFFTCSC